MEKMAKKPLHLMILFGLLLIFTAACSPTKDTNKEAIESVIKTAFTLPDEELMVEINDSGNATYIGDISSSESLTLKNQDNGIEKLLQERYGDTFTKYGYEKFVSSTASVYPMLAEQSGYLTTVEKVIIEQDKYNPNRYDFEAEITYTTHDGEEKKTTMMGKAECTQEKGKIDSLDIHDDGGLAKEMSGESGH
ncbi:MAG: hypothetical protein WBA84_01815 [Carnobacterium sp.]|uniref:hypothetical protein n=1 Tax=Carnobacterium sp. TaxID=48221 RepID=UPI003C7100FA